jgi:hypothetical protein
LLQGSAGRQCKVWVVVAARRDIVITRPPKIHCSARSVEHKHRVKHMPPPAAMLLFGDTKILIKQI